MTSPKVQKILKRLLLEPDFKGLIKQAQADPDNVRKYVQQARKRFGLSQYWEVLLQHVLIIGTFNEKILHSGLAIERGFDAVTEQEYFKIVVFPEIIQKEVVTTYGRIARIYEENGQDIDIRTAKRDASEYHALELHLQGKSHKEIADIISNENVGYGASEIPNLIKEAKRKSQR